MGNNVFSDFDMSGFQPVCEQVKAEIASLDAAGRRKALLTLFGCIDNTTLSGSDTPSGVAAFCRSARGLAVPSPQGPVGVASVCVYPCFVGVAKRELAGSALRVASVAGGFPAGQTSQSIKIDEVRYAVGEGADEVDFVINRGRLLDGEVQYVSDEIAAAKAVCGNEVKLTAKEFDLLLLFISNRGRVFSRKEMMEKVWNYERPGDDRTVDVHIRRLREKIEPDTTQPEFIITKWGVGYYFTDED